MQKRLNPERTKPLRMNNRDKDSTREKTSLHHPHISIDTPVQYVKGVGPARARLLGRLGIETLGDILYHSPGAMKTEKT